VQPKTRYARSGDASIAYQVVGEGSSDLLFVSGFVSHLELIWEEPTAARFFDGLASFSRLILFDKRGMGLSDRTGVAPTLEQVADDALAVLDAAGSERAAVFAISEGGPAAIVLAATYPERVTQLVLYGTWARIVRGADYPFGFTLDQLRATRTYFAERWGDPVAAVAFIPSMVDDQGFLAWWARFLRLGASPGGMVDLMRLYEEIDVRPVLPVIQQPTLVLHGVAGIAVHTGARVAALAEPGEVLVSRTVRDLVAGSGLAFEDRGVSRLKGVEGDWQLYAVV